MAFRLKRRGIDDAKKILVYGNDGTGKSTFAAEYCKEHGLKPIVIDIDDTNYTDCDIVDLTLTNDIKTFNQVKAVIDEIGKTDKYDTIILDGVSSLIEMLVSKDPGIKKYEVRNDRFKQILKRITASGKNIIFIGQADMRVVCNEDFQSNKLIIKVNSIVNEKYHCFIDDDGKYGYEVEKFREATNQPEEEPVNEPEPVKETPKPTRIRHSSRREEPKPEPKKVEVFDTNQTPKGASKLDNAAEIAASIVEELPKKTLIQGYEELIRLHRNGVLADDECPAIRMELERLLA